MRRSLLLVATGLTLGLVLAASSAVSAQVAKSGSFSFHSGYKGVGETTEISEQRSYWSGKYWGVSFNDKGEGLLHNMVWGCPAAYEVVDGTLNMKGFCVLRDADDDKIFGAFAGSGPWGGELAGSTKVTGGTGKYAGIQGTWDFRCRAVGAENQFYCHQQANFTFP